MKHTAYLFTGIFLLLFLLNCNPTGNSLPDIPVAPAQSTPINRSANISTMPTLTWCAVSGASTYWLQVSTISTFTTRVVNDSTFTINSKTFNSALNYNTTYYWRINAKNTSGTSVWSPVWSFSTGFRSVIFSDSVADLDGNVYHAIRIGTQTWTVENLRTTKYNDGTSIPLIIDSIAWSISTTPGYCFYKNTTNADSIKKNGALYNWFSVTTCKLAPTGWHIPTDAEWDTLENYLVANGYNCDASTGFGYNLLAKALAAQTDWVFDTNFGAIGNNLGANNRSGFSALPGGYRNSNGKFDFIGHNGFWWSSTVLGVSYAYYRSLCFDRPSIFPNENYFGSFGYSVRLVKNR